MKQNIFLLPTTQKTKLHKDHNGFFSSPKMQVSSTINSIVEGFNLYIISDEPIKKGDYTLMFDSLGNLWCNEPQQYLGIEEGHHLNDGLRKIVMTTDNELKMDRVSSADNFIKYYIENQPNYIEVKRDSFKILGGAEAVFYELIYTKQPIFYSELEVVALLKEFNETAMNFINQDDRNIMSASTLKKWFELNKFK